MAFVDNSLFAISLRVIKKAPRRCLTSTLTSSSSSASSSAVRWKGVEDMLTSSLPIDAKIPNANAFRRFLVEEIRKTGHLRDTYIPLFFWDTSVDRLVLSDAQLDPSYICSLVGKCLRLSSLKMSNCYKVDDACVATLLSGRNGAVGLKELSLEGCRRISDKTLDVLCEKAGQLECINLGGCFNLTNAGIRRFLTTFRNRGRVRFLGLAGLGIEADVLLGLPGRFPSLDSVSLGYFRGSDQTLVDFLRNMSRLRVLRVHYSDWLTDVVVEAIASYCPKITSVDLKGCVKVTHTAIHDLLRRSSAVTSDASIGNRGVLEESASAMDVVVTKEDAGAAVTQTAEDDETSASSSSSQIESRSSERCLRKLFVEHVKMDKTVLAYYRATFPSVQIVA